MFIDIEKGTTLKKFPFKSIAVPRPIAWISTMGEDGSSNLAPYSQFTNVTFDPPIIMFSINRDAEGKKKHTLINIEANKEFVHNLVTLPLLDQMNITASDFEYGVDEFKKANLTKLPSQFVKPYRVKESPIQLECTAIQIITIEGEHKMGTAEIVIGRVLGMHIDDEIILPDDRIDVGRIKPLARLGYNEYTFVEKVIPVEPIATDNAQHKFGLEGNTNY